MAHDSERILVLWKKGQNFFASFFTEVSNVRKAINNDAMFVRWCAEDLGLPLVTITRISDVLTLADAARVKAELASARAVEQEQRRKEREYREFVAAQERKRKEDEKALAAAQKAREEEQKKAADREARSKQSKKKNNAGWRRTEKNALNKALAAVSGAGSNVVSFATPRLPDTSDKQLVKNIKEAITRLGRSREEWIEASVSLASLLCEARARYPADQKFSYWLEENEIDIYHMDRAALLKLGQNTEAMRVILRRTDSTSYRLIWKDTQKQIEASVG